VNLQTSDNHRNYGLPTHSQFPIVNNSSDQIIQKFQLIVWGSMLLLTVSTAVMTVFTLQRSYTFPTRSDFIPCFQVTQNLHPARAGQALVHILRCMARRSLQGFSMASSRLYAPTEVSTHRKVPLSWKVPLLCQMGIRSTPPVPTHHSPDGSGVPRHPRTTI